MIEHLWRQRLGRQPHRPHPVRLMNVERQLNINPMHIIGSVHQQSSIVQQLTQPQRLTVDRRIHFRSYLLRSK